MKKFFLSNFWVLFIAILLSMVAVSHIGVMSVFRQTEKDPSSTIKFSTSLLSEKIEGLSAAEIDPYLRQMEQNLGAKMVMLGLDDKSLPDDLNHDLARSGVAVRMTRSMFNHGVTIYVPVEINGARKVVVAGPVERPYSPDFEAYLYMALLVLIILILSSLMVSLPMLKRLRVLEKTARQIADGDLDARVPIPSGDGLVGFVALQFNRMAGRIAQLMASQKMILQAVSHELRTPTARIRFGLEMLESVDDPVERRRRLDAIDEDLTDVDDLVEELLLFNKMEALGQNIEKSVIMVAPLIDKLVEKRVFLRPGIEVTVDMARNDPAGLAVLADQRAFARAIGNLLSNALKFAATRVQIVVRKAPGALEISVCDDGPGVPLAERISIFEPFKRLDDSRNRESGGAGLGLAIVSTIIASHDGRVEVGDATIGGARFTTWWPAP
jgi:two-component system sensor histidine kinase RstB